MTTRDRTSTFKAMRKSHSRSQKHSSIHKNVDLEEERIDLMSNKPTVSQIVWMPLIEEARDKTKQIKRSLFALDRLISQFFLVDFDDEDDDLLQQITNTSKKIKDQCSEAKQLLVRANGIQIRENIRSETTMRQNMISNLISDLESVSRQFREKEKNFMSRYKSMTSKGNVWDLSHETNYHPQISPHNLLQSSSAQTSEYTSLLGSDQLQLSKMEEGRMISQEIQDREKEIIQLASSVEEVSRLFQDFYLLTQQQTTIIDQIDSNCESAAVNVDRGVIEIKGASEIQKKSRSIRCCLLIAVIVLVIIICIIVGIVVGLKDSMKV